MKSDSNILAELMQEAPTLAAVDRRMPYTVSGTYFSTLHDEVLAQIAADNLPKATIPYTVPQDYFNTLSNNVLTAVAKEATNKNEIFIELAAIAPTLNAIDKANVYTLPEDYFSKFKTGINDATSSAKVVSISTIKRKVLYIAAACVIGIMAVSAFIFTKNSNKIDYAAYKHIDVNSAIDKLSNEELLNYLENVNSITNANSLTTLDVKLPDIQEHIQTVSDEELKQYLKEVDLPASEEQQLGI